MKRALIITSIVVFIACAQGNQTTTTKPNLDLYSKPIPAFAKPPGANSLLRLEEAGAWFSYDPAKWTLIDEKSPVFQDANRTAKKQGLEIKYLLMNHADAFITLSETRVKSTYTESHERMLTLSQRDSSFSDVALDLRSVNGMVLLHCSFSKNEQGNLFDGDYYHMTTIKGTAALAGATMKNGKTPRHEVVSALNGLAAD